MNISFCTKCGSDQVVWKIPAGDNTKRQICNSCGMIHYANPKIIVGCLPDFDEKILLCKRAINPRLGYWTLPAGFMENGETTEEGALRETMEEANANVELQSLYTVFNVPHISQVHMLFRGKLLDLNFSPGEETLDLKLFDAEEIPWDEIAFPSIKKTLRHYLEDRKKGIFELRMETLRPRT